MRAILAIMLSFLPLAAGAQTCPSGFEEFIREFETSTDFQRAHSRFPLTYQYIDAMADPEPKPIDVVVTRERAGEFPGIEYPSAAKQSAVPLRRKIAAPDPNTRAVSLVPA